MSIAKQQGLTYQEGLKTTSDGAVSQDSEKTSSDDSRTIVIVGALLSFVILVVIAVMLTILKN
jgi:hypothetical protein